MRQSLIPFLRYLPWPDNDGKATKDGGNTEDEQELISKESSAVELQHQLESWKASYRQLQQWTILGGVVVVLVLVGLAIPAAKSCSGGSNDGQTSHFVPSMPVTKVTFEQDSHFAGPSSPDNDRAWNALMPDGDGFILIETPKEYKLPPGKPAANGDIYDISLFHQLHCLEGIRNHLYLLQGSIGRNNSQEIHDILLDPQVPHIYHCLDYIRQALMCAGDMTVEWPREEADGSRFAFDGWGVTHQCKSWDAIMKFMKDNSASNAWAS